MKLLLLMLLMSSKAPEIRVDRVPQSTPDYLECDSRVTAASILTSSKTPKSVIYHYGKKELLLEDVKEGNVPLDDWNDYIMGETTRFKLKRFRRGLYGTEYPEDADRFGDSTYNWLVKIKLNPECLKPSKVISLVYLSKNVAFQKWYESKFYTHSYDRWKAMCFDSEAYPRYQHFISYKNPDEKADFKESECEKVVGDYYEDQNFAFVHDYAGDLVRSWAIRDRECILDIQGSDLFWTKEFSSKDELWVNTCRSQRNHRNNIRVWFAAIENAGIEVRDLERFSKMIGEIKPPEDQSDWQMDETDRFAAQDFSSSLLYAAKRCGSAKQKTFRSGLGEISKSVDQMQSSEVQTKLENLCR